jgi:hypothetical protein
LVPNPDNASGAAQQRIDSYTQKISVSVKEQTWSEWLKFAHEEINTVKAIVIAIGSVATVTLAGLAYPSGDGTDGRPQQSARLHHVGQRQFNP